MSAKDLIVKVISSRDARRFISLHHYSGKFVNNSRLHFGVFWNDKLEGVLQYGCSMDISKVVGLVKDTKWNDFMELNRMAFSEKLPRNSESRAISITMRLIKKSYPNIKWILSFADAQQCGDGTIYRASGFVLTGFSSGLMWKLPKDLSLINGGDVAHRLKVQDKCSKLSKHIMNLTKGKCLTMKGYCNKFGGHILEGYNFRYVYFIDKRYKEKLTVPEIPFSKIKEMNASMYKGEKV